MKNFNLKKALVSVSALMLALFAFLPNQAIAQGVTSANIVGQVLDSKGTPIPFALVVAKHEPSGSTYGVETRDDGRFNLPNVRVGGPYTITVKMAGYKDYSESDISLSLGQNYRFNATLVESSVALDVVTITSDKNSLINNNRTGAGQNIDRQTLAVAPTLNRSFNDFLRMTPQGRSTSVASTAGGGISFGGQDSRFNNLTIDGSVFNNSFGLASGPGGQANAQPISMDAIDEIQVNIAPYDVRQGGFTGAGVNAVTKSGTNQLRVTGFFNTRNQSMVGSKADTSTVSVNNFDVKQFGLSIGGPIIKDKAFFFVNFEGERRSDPMVFLANRGEAVGGNVTRVRATMLDSLSNFLKNTFGYDPGVYDNYNLPTYSNKAIAKFDYNINQANRLSIRLNWLRSYREVLASSSGVVSGNRNFTLDALNFRGSNYTINNDIYSGIAELNTMIGSTISNNFQIGFTANRDYRSAINSTKFPTVDIMESGRTLTTFGYEPFTYENVLNTNTFQLKDDITFYKGNHTITAGVNLEAFKFENSFQPRIFGIWAYNNVGDFYRSAGGDTNVTVRRVRQTYPLAGNEIPFAVTRAYMPGVYVQDEIAMLNDKLHLTLGVRVDVPFFGETSAVENTAASQLNFLDENKETIRYNTATLPKTHALISPRLGFNWDVLGNKKFQVRGGTGLFAGRPAFVWISNQISNNGVIQGEFLYNSVKRDIQNRYFTFNTAAANVRAFDPSVRSAGTYNLAVTDPNFKWPQVWRTNIGMDYQLPAGFVASLEGIYTRTVNNVAYINANMPAPIGTLAGLDGDNRNIYASDRINAGVTDNTVLINTDKGYTFSITPKIEKQFKNNWAAMLAYNYAVAKDVMSAGSIANSSWTGYSTVQGNNYPGLSFADADQRHRIIGSVSYRLDWEKMVNIPVVGPTTISMFFQTGNQGNVTFNVNGDANGDRLANNDLMFVPSDFTKVRFNTVTSNGVTFTQAQQQEAFKAYVENNTYLNSRKGMYAERNGWQLPFYATVDLSLQQELYVKVGERKHTIQLRWDVYNFGNMLNKAWGVANRVQYAAPLTYASRDAATNQNIYTWQAVNGRLVTDPLLPSASLSDVWQSQIGIRYIF